MRNASGTARPAPLAPCGLMFAAMDGAISASDRPTACHTERERLSPGAVAEVCWAGVVAMVTPVEHDCYQQSARQLPIREGGNVTAVTLPCASQSHDRGASERLRASRHLT